MPASLGAVGVAAVGDGVAVALGTHALSAMTTSTVTNGYRPTPERDRAGTSSLFMAKVALPDPQAVQSMTTLPHWPDRVTSNASLKSFAAKRCVITEVMSSPDCSMEPMRYQVSNISRP